MDYSRKTYGELFQYLVEKQNAVPLGLYRGVLANDKKTNKPRGNKQPYVFTNPSKDTRLAPEDAVFIIARVSDAGNVTRVPAPHILECSFSYAIDIHFISNLIVLF